MAAVYSEDFEGLAVGDRYGISTLAGTGPDDVGPDDQRAIVSGDHPRAGLHTLAAGGGSVAVPWDLGTTDDLTVTVWAYVPAAGDPAADVFTITIAQGDASHLYMMQMQVADNPAFYPEGEYVANGVYLNGYDIDSGTIGTIATAYTGITLAPGFHEFAWVRTGGDWALVIDGSASISPSGWSTATSPFAAVFISTLASTFQKSYSCAVSLDPSTSYIDSVLIAAGSGGDGGGPAGVVTLPSAHAEMPDPIGTVPLASFSLTRELTGQTIPGNIRAKSGLSVGDLTITFPMPPGVHPWGPSGHRPITGVLIPVTVGDIPLGVWLAQPMSGNLTGPAVSLGLLERQYAGRQIPANVPDPGGTRDVAWLLTQLAGKAGFMVAELDIPATIGVTVDYLPGTGWGWQADTDVWSAIQQVCAASLCAAWVDAAGVLHVRTRQELTGVGVPITTMDAGQVATDIPWTIDPADTADRLEVSWTDPAGTADVVGRGVAATVAANVISIDVGWLIHTEADAIEIADHLWGRVSSQHWQASSVRVRLDWTHDIGDVLLLTHTRTGLAQRVLITKVQIDGQPGEYAQTLDLVLLVWTWADWDQAWDGKTWAAFDAAWAGKTWADFDDQPLSTGA